MKYLLIAFSILTLSTVTFAQQPPGSYLKSCYECSYNKTTDILSCVGCSRKDGTMAHNVTLDRAMACVNRGYDIANVNGRLVCQEKLTIKSTVSK